MRETMTGSRRARARAQRATRAIAAIAGVTMGLAGLWAFLDARGFGDFAQFPPYNEHLIHDLGSWLIGLGAALLLALAFADALLVALGAAAAGNLMHFLSHLIDQDLGGRGTDPLLYGLLALVLCLATWVRYRERG